jgi:hypothetical protein
MYFWMQNMYRTLISSMVYSCITLFIITACSDLSELVNSTAWELSACALCNVAVQVGDRIVWQIP